MFNLHAGIPSEHVKDVFLDKNIPPAVVDFLLQTLRICQDEIHMETPSTQSLWFAHVEFTTLLHVASKSLIN